ncbi:sugar transferase [Virgibacillus ndiopensis]|uniref:sugar transferase n=1 Tax=Virgibacillus ndiopensis TaxID=2004408 RepID=UPI00159BD39F|nr:sugar transferase [Virgibacillus ndiopensis]
MEVQQNIRVKADLRKRGITYFIAKRIIDIVISTLLLVFLIPFLLVISFIIYKREGGPILFKEACIGKNNRPFILWKFRTTTIPSKVIRAFPPHPFPNSWSEGVPNEFVYRNNSPASMTKTGIWLKKYRIDMIPELINVLKGDMSLVGPQPETPEIAYRYKGKQIDRLNMRPGITGYAQVNGKSNNNHHGQKIAYDLYYIKNCSLQFDLKIFTKAISRLFIN